MVEFPSSWEPKIEYQSGILEQISGIIDSFASNQGVVFRLQAIRADLSNEESVEEDVIRIILYRWSEETPAVREEYQLERDQIEKLLPKILNMSQEGLIGKTSTIRDILICTHGQRDLCCGRFGYPIYKASRSLQTTQVRIWRSSHLTGHRASPTLLDLPKGEFWGYITEKLVKKLVSDNFPSADEFLSHYRGGTAMTPEQQLVDREGYITYGQKWGQYPIVRTEYVHSEATKVKLIRGNLEIERMVFASKVPVTIGETRCGLLKPISEVRVIE